MPQPNITIQDSLSAQQTGKLWFNRNEWMRFRLFGTTTDNTLTELFVDGISGNRIVIPANSMVVFRAMCASISGTEGSGACINGAVQNIGGTVATVGTNVADAFNDASAQTTYTIDGDNTNDSLRVRVTGTSATTIYHEVLIDVAVATDPESNFGRLS